MPSLSEMANLRLEGFDRHKGRLSAVNVKSPTRDKVDLLYAALRAHAVACGWQEMKEGKHTGLVGRTSLSAAIRILFQGEAPDEKLDHMAGTVAAAAQKEGLINLVARSAPGEDPIWWVASNYEEVTGRKPLDASVADTIASQKKTAPAAKSADKDKVKVYGKTKSKTSQTRHRKRTRKPPANTLDRMYQVRAVLDEVGGRYDTALTYAEIMAEMANRDQKISLSQLITAVDLLVAEGQAAQRAMSKADKDAIHAAGGPRPGGKPPVIAMLRKHMSGKEIPTILGTLDQIRGTESERGDKEAPQVAPEAPPAAPEAKTEPQAAKPEEELVSAVAEDLTQDGEGAVLESVIRDTMALPESEARERLVAQRMRVLELEARVAKLEKARDGLLAALETMKD